MIKENAQSTVEPVVSRSLCQFMECIHFPSIFASNQKKKTFPVCFADHRVYLFLIPSLFFPPNAAIQRSHKKANGMLAWEMLYMEPDVGLPADATTPPSRAIKMFSWRQLSPLSKSLPTSARHVGEASLSARTETTKRCPWGTLPWLESLLRGIPEHSFHWPHHQFPAKKTRQTPNLPHNIPFDVPVLVLPLIKTMEILFFPFKSSYCSA